MRLPEGRFQISMVGKERCWKWGQAALSAASSHSKSNRSSKNVRRMGGQGKEGGETETS
jgi:hypothetical protein